MSNQTIRQVLLCLSSCVFLSESMQAAQLPEKAIASPSEACYLSQRQQPGPSLAEQRVFSFRAEWRDSPWPLCDSHQVAGPPQRKERTTEYWDRLREAEIKLEDNFRRSAKSVPEHQTWIYFQKRRADKQASFAQRGRQFCQLPFFSGEVLEKPPHILYQTLHTLASERSCEIVEIYPSIKVVLLKDSYSCALYLWDLQEGILVNPYRKNDNLSLDPSRTEEECYMAEMAADRGAQSFFIRLRQQVNTCLYSFWLARSKAEELVIKCLFKYFYNMPVRRVKNVLYGGTGKLYVWWQLRSRASHEMAGPPLIGYELIELPEGYGTAGPCVLRLDRDTAQVKPQAVQLLPGKHGRPAFLLAQTEKSPPTLSLYDLQGKEVFSTLLALGERKYKFVKAIFEPKTGYLRLYLSEEKGGDGELKERIYWLNRDGGKLSFQLGMEQTLFTGKDFTMLGPDKERRLYGSYVSAESADGKKLSTFVAPMGTIALLLSVSDRPKASARKLDSPPAQPSQEKHLRIRREMGDAKASQGEESGGLDDDDDEAPQESEIEAPQGGPKGLVTIDMGTKRFVLNRVVLEQKLPTFIPMERFQTLAEQAGKGRDLLLKESEGVTATNFELALKYLDGIAPPTREDAQSVINVFSEYGQLDLVWQVCDEYSLPVPEMVEKDAAVKLAKRYIEGEKDIVTPQNAQSVVEVLHAYGHPGLVKEICEKYALSEPSQPMEHTKKYAQQPIQEETPENAAHAYDGSDTESEDNPYPVHATVKAGEYKTLKGLLKVAKELINQHDDQGNTPLDYAIKESRIYRLLQKKGGKHRSELS